MRKRSTLFVLWVAALLAAFAGCAAARADHRVALVIGNSNYVNTPPLANPVNDAGDIAESLTSLGFAVHLQLDASKRDFDHTLEAFARDARTADAALVYYAGHGMQYRGVNYLMPIDAALKDDVSLRYEMIAAADVISALQELSGVKVLILDACRDNPLAKKLGRSIVASTRGAWIEGLAKTERISGMIVVYATQADEVANDGGGRNSPFAAALLKELKTPRLEIGTLFRRVEADVEAATDGQQSPELSISLASEFYINMTETDQVVWARVRLSSNAEALKDFIRRYPESFYIPDAELRLKLLEAPTPAMSVAVLPTEPAHPSPSPDIPVVTPEKPAPPVAPTPVAKLKSPVEAKPVVSPPNYRAQIIAELRRLGCAEPAWGPKAVEQGLARYASVAHLTAMVEPSAALLNDLAKLPDHFCPPQCGLQETAVNGLCIRKTCKPNMVLSSSGQCVIRTVRQAPTVTPSIEAGPQHRRKPSPEGPGGGANQCITFNGSSICD